jgi:hypothetical protein
MTREDMLVLHDYLCGKAKALMVTKNADYTGKRGTFANLKMSELISIAPEKGILLRCLDKISRIDALVEGGELQVKSESITDSIVDVINYMILLAGLLQEREENKTVGYTPEQLEVIERHLDPVKLEHPQAGDSGNGDILGDIVKNVQNHHSAVISHRM